MKKRNLLILGLLLIGAQLAGAASFQYIFNNVEQGNNSTSNPSITVDGDKVTKKGGNAQDPLVLTNTPEPAAPAAMAERKAEEPISEPISHVRLSLGANFISNTNAPSINTLHSSTVSYSGTLSYFPLRDLGISFLAMSSKATHQNHFGGELEIVPVRMEVFGMKNFLDLAALGGYTTLGKEEAAKGSPHVGARLDLNFNSHVSISVAGRTNIANRDLYQYSMADLGLAWHF